MARVLLTVEFEADEERLGYILDEVAMAVETPSPIFGLEVDGEHRDPDSPTEGLS